MPKENQRVTLSKRLLKEGLLKILEKKHISDISISELCQQTGINRTTFYRHYQTPHDVLLESEYDLIQRFYEAPALPKNSKNMKKRLLFVCDFLYANKDLIKLFIKNNTDSDLSFLYEKLFWEHITDRIIFYKGKPIDQDTLKLSTTFWIYGMHGLTRQWISEDIPKTTEEMADLIFHLFYADFTFE